MKTQDLIANLNELTKIDKHVFASDLLKAINDDNLRRDMLSLLVKNNIAFTLCTISSEISYLAHRIYEMHDYSDNDVAYLESSLDALREYKDQITRVQEYVDLKKKAGDVESTIYDYQRQVIGCRLYEYKCDIEITY